MNSSPRQVSLLWCIVLLAIQDPLGVESTQVGITRRDFHGRNQGDHPAEPFLDEDFPRDANNPLEKAMDKIYKDQSDDTTTANASLAQNANATTTTETEESQHKS